MSLDSRWGYEGIRYDVPFNDSSLADTIAVDVTRHIIGSDSLGQTGDLAVCDDTVLVVFDGGVDQHSSEFWSTFGLRYTF